MDSSQQSLVSWSALSLFFGLVNQKLDLGEVADLEEQGGQ